MEERGKGRAGFWVKPFLEIIIPLGIVCLVIGSLVGWRISFSLLTTLIRADASVWLWKSAGLSAWITFLITISWTSFTLILTYFMADWLEKKFFISKAIIKIFLSWSWFCSQREKAITHQNRLLTWLDSHHSFFIYLILIVPFTPFIETVAIAAGRLLEIRGKIRGVLLKLLLANAGKIALVTFFVFKLWRVLF